MKTPRIHHVSFIIGDCARSEIFYREILNLQPSTIRPDLGYPGIWYQLGSQQLHLLQLEPPYVLTDRQIHGGRDRHLALLTEHFDEIVDRLKQHQIPFSLSRSGRKALFFRDPDDNVIELIAPTNDCD